MVLLALLFACGSDGMAPDDPGIDANVCSCPGAEALEHDMIERHTETLTLPGGLIRGFAYVCDNDEGKITIAGGCFVEPLTPNMGLVIHSTYTFQGTMSWLCGLDLRNAGMSLDITVSTLCMVPPETDLIEPEAIPGCDCPPIEPIKARVQNVSMTGAIRAQSVSTYEATCAEDHQLIGGECESSILLSNPDVWLVSSGPAEDGKSWTCSWRNDQPDASFTAMVKATCVRPVIPGTAPDEIPISEQAAIISKEDTLSADGSHTIEAACPPGKLPLWGGCVVTEGAETSEVRLARSSFLPESDNNPNVWHCTWNNPGSDTTPKAKAFATCVDRPEPSSSSLF